MRQLMLCCDGHLMSINRRSVRSDHDLTLGTRLMADPAGPDVPHVQDSRN
jgi:hypothetical protein